MNNIKIKKIDPTARGLLFYENNFDAGMDICSNEEVTLESFSPRKISTGISMQIPDNKVALVWDKSSVSANGLKVMGGVIDARYRGEIFITLINLTKETIVIPKGKRIAQIIIQNYIRISSLKEVDELGEGFGHKDF